MCTSSSFWEVLIVPVRRDPWRAWQDEIRVVVGSVRTNMRPQVVWLERDGLIQVAVSPVTDREGTIEAYRLEWLGPDRQRGSVTVDHELQPVSPQT
jgi:hypothetical protein